MRQRVVAAMEALGTVSVRDLALHLDRSAESLYFHLRKLVECGLVLGDGERPTQRRPEQLYRLVAPKLRIAGDPEDPEFGDALTEAGRSVLRAADRDYARAIEGGIGRLNGPARNLSLQHYHVHLTPAHRQRLVRMLEELTTFVLENNDPARGELHSLTAVLSPVARPPRSTDA